MVTSCRLCRSLTLATSPGTLSHHPRVPGQVRVICRWNEPASCVCVRVIDQSATGNSPFGHSLHKHVFHARDRWGARDGNGSRDRVSPGTDPHTARSLRAPLPGGRPPRKAQLNSGLRPRSRPLLPPCYALLSNRRGVSSSGHAGIPSPPHPSPGGVRGPAAFCGRTTRGLWGLGGPRGALELGPDEGMGPKQPEMGPLCPSLRQGHMSTPRQGPWRTQVHPRPGHWLGA